MAFFSPVPPFSAAMRTWFVVNCTAACYPVDVRVLRARVSKYGNTRVHTRQQIHREHHHGVIKRHRASNPTLILPSIPSHLCPRRPWVSAHVRPSSRVRLWWFPVCLLLIISCNAIDDIMASKVNLLFVPFEKSINSSSHSLLPTDKIWFKGDHLVLWCVRDFLFLMRWVLTKMIIVSFRTAYYYLLLTKRSNPFVFLSLYNPNNSFLTAPVFSLKAVGFLGTLPEVKRGAM